MSDKVKPSEHVKEGGQKANDRLEKPPDASTVRNASKEQMDDALGQNPIITKGMTELAYKDGFVDSPDKRSMELLIAINPQTGKEETIDKTSTTREKDIKRNISLDSHPTRMIPAMTPEAETKIRAEQQAKHEEISQSATMMAIEASHNPAMEPVANLRKYADQLPKGAEQEKWTALSRKLAAEQSPEMRARYEQFQGGTHPAITPEMVAGLPPNTAEKTADGWLLKVNAAENIDTEQEETSSIERIAALPIDKQAQVIGAGILAYQQEMSRQQFQIMVGTIAGVGDGAVSLAKGAEEAAKTLGEIWQFSQEVMLNDPTAIEKAGKAGEAIGKTLVGGVRLWQVSEAYLGDIGATGDYSKPFKDISWLGEQIDQRWNAMTPAEQSRLAAKLSTEFLGGLAAGFGIAKLAKSEKITGVLEELGAAANELGGKSKKKVGKFISGLLDEITPQPTAVTPDGQRIPTPRKGRDNYLMSKADDLGDTKGRPPEGRQERGATPENFVASERFMAQLKLVVDRLSEGERNFLAEHNVAIKPIRRMADRFPTRQDLAACYDASENTIYVAEEVPKLGSFVHNYDLEFAFRHEFGHAHNFKAHPFGDPISETPKFRAAFKHDIKSIPADVLETLKLSPSHKTVLEARDEVFADMYAHATCLESNNPYSQTMKRWFPNCLQYARTRLL